MIGWSAGKVVPVRLRALAYRLFARAVGADLDEVEFELGGYASLGDFFARKLRPGAREVDPAPASIISPCDGVIAARGIATAGELVQAKGRMYQLAELVADAALAARLTGGPYATIYLSPRDYHRVHAPADAQILGFDYLPGALWPVNPRVAARRDALLSRNERIVIRMKSSALGHVALVMVGAAGVGNIRLAPALSGRGAGPVCGAVGDSAGWRGAGEPRRIELTGVHVKRGDELGAFRLGSTVVLVFEPRSAELAGEVGDAVRFGQRLGRVGGGS